MPLHRQQASATRVSGAGALLHLQAVLRAARARVPLHRAHRSARPYQVPVHYCTLQAGATSSTSASAATVCTAGVPGVPGAGPLDAPTSRATSSTPARCRKPAIAPCSEPRHVHATRPARCEPVYTEKVRQGLHRLTGTRSSLLSRPGRDTSAASCRAPAPSTPAPARRTTAPARRSIPGAVPRPLRSAKRSGCRARSAAPSAAATTSPQSMPPGNYTVCQQVPYTVMKPALLHHLPDGAGRALPHGDAPAALWCPSRRCSASRTPPARWSPSSTAAW